MAWHFWPAPTKVKINMLYLFYILLFFFMIKIGWYLLLPIKTIFLWSDEKKKEQSVSWDPLEFILLPMISVISYFNNEITIFGLSGWSIFGYGFFAIVLTYAYVILFFWLTKRIDMS